MKNFGKRNCQFLCLLKDFPVTISLENHGELTAYSRCSINLPVAAHGKNIARREKLHSKLTLLAALTASQGRKNWVNPEDNLMLSKEVQSEGIMLYTSKTKKEKVERYKDCSLFQSKPSKDNLINKLSQGEASISPDLEVNELDLAMQFGERDVPPWGDDCQEVLEDEDFHCGLEQKFGENDHHVYPSIENSAYINKLGDDGLSDFNIYNNNNNYYYCNIKKTDSYDNMKVITSTNLSDIIPMSYQEQMNNMNYNVQSFNNIKTEVKEEYDLYPDSYIMESDDSGDINIGREEVIEFEVHGSQLKDKLGDAKMDGIVECETRLEDVIPDVRHEGVDVSNVELMGVEDIIPAQKFKVENTEGFYNTDIKKEDMKLLLEKNVFRPSFNVPTQELDFMDFVGYINNEINPDSAGTPQLHNEIFKELETIDVYEDVDSMSIAERIKTGLSRKRQSRYSFKNLQPSQDEDNQYEYGAPQKKSRSRNYESASSNFSYDSYEDFCRKRRYKNNEASRRSRQNKKDKERQLYKSWEEAERRNAVLKSKADKLEKLVTHLRQLLLQLVLKKRNGT